MNSIKVIVFDFGGVIEQYDQGSFTEFLLDQWNPTQRVSLGEFRNAFWVGEPDYAIGKETPDIFFSKFLETLGKSLSPEDKRRFLETFRESFSINMEMISLIQSLKKRYRMILLSNNYPERSQSVRKQFGKYFDALYFSNEMGFRKPDSKAFEFLLRKEKLKSSECIFVDDIASNILTAKKLGFQAIEFENKPQLEKALQALGVTP